MVREICSISSCTGRVKARGLCNKHYLVARRSGSISSLNRTERVLQFVEDCIMSETDSCLEPSFKSKSEYPSFVWEGVYYKIGWLVLEICEGDRPAGTEMRHLCGNPRCCNPRHLKWDTHSENMKDLKVHGTAPDFNGEKNPNSVATPEQVEYIRKYHRKGRGPYDKGNTMLIARRLGLTRVIVLAISRGDTWNASDRL